MLFWLLGHSVARVIVTTQSAEDLINVANQAVALCSFSPTQTMAGVKPETEEEAPFLARIDEEELEAKDSGPKKRLDHRKFQICIALIHAVLFVANALWFFTNLTHRPICATCPTESPGVYGK